MAMRRGALRSGQAVVRAWHGAGLDTAASASQVHAFGAAAGNASTTMTTTTWLARGFRSQRSAVTATTMPTTTSNVFRGAAATAATDARGGAAVAVGPFSSPHLLTQHRGMAKGKGKNKKGGKGGKAAATSDDDDEEEDEEDAAAAEGAGDDAPEFDPSVVDELMEAAIESLERDLGKLRTGRQGTGGDWRGPGGLHTQSPTHFITVALRLN
jgi:hypothetical protein